MAKRFRFSRTARAGYDRQGYVWFTSRMYRYLSAGQKDTIRQTCWKAAGEEWEALMAYVTTGQTMDQVCRAYLTTPERVGRHYRRYLELFPRVLRE